jgi:hypothetical protein
MKSLQPQLCRALKVPSADWPACYLEFRICKIGTRTVMKSYLALGIAIVGMALIVAGVAVLNLLSKSAGH